MLKRLNLRITEKYFLKKTHKIIKAQNFKKNDNHNL
mgnify:CR=1 FL=1